MNVRPSTAGEDSYLASVSDLMVGLLFVFIIMLMAFALNFRSAEEKAEGTRSELATELESLRAERDRLKAERQKLTRQKQKLLADRSVLREMLARLAERQTARARMLQEIASEMQARRVEVDLDPGKGILRIPEELLFPSGEADFTPAGERALGVLAEVLSRVLPCYSLVPPGTPSRCPGTVRPVLEAVLIEGHTDDQPIRSGPYPDNWALGSARGINTFKHLVADAPLLDRLRNSHGQALLGVSSYEARRPVVDARTPEARRLNRRIDIRFLLAAPSPKELAEMQAQLGEARASGDRP